MMTDHEPPPAAHPNTLGDETHERGDAVPLGQTSARFSRALEAEIARRMRAKPPVTLQEATEALHARLEWGGDEPQGAIPGRVSGPHLRTQAMVDDRNATKRETPRGIPFLGKWTLRRPVFYALSVMVVFICASLTIIRLTDKQAPLDALPPRIYTTAPGQQVVVSLADGVRVLLGPATTLSIKNQSTSIGVSAHVKGQALFTILRNARHPFQVQVGNAVARVLGTTFMVRQYPTDHRARVLVVDGRVSLTGIRENRLAEPDRVLTANMLAVVNDSGQVDVTPHVAIGEYTSWSTGELIFHNTPIRDVVAELSRAYDVDLRVGDSVLAARTLDWAVLVRQQSLDDVLPPLAAVLNAHPVRTGRIITLVPGRPGSRPPIQLPFPSTVERYYGR